MSKKTNKKMLMALFLATLVLGACAINMDRDDEEEIIDNKDESAEETTDQSEEEAYNNLDQEEIGEMIETDDGMRRIVKTLYGINESQVSGPFEIRIEDLQLSQFQPTNDMIDAYGGDNLTMITIKLEVENKSNETHSIYPNQGRIMTDTEDKVDAHFSLSDQVGGEFDGELTKKGLVYCFFYGQAEDISELSFLIEAGHDENIEVLGENLEFNFELD